MEPTSWLYSNMHTNDYEFDRNLVTVEGTFPCKVLSASYVEAGLQLDKKGEPLSEHYDVIVKFIDGPNLGGGFQARYWMSEKSGAPNFKDLGVLGSLGKAIYGERHDVPPSPDDVIGCVVEATVSFVNGFPQIYHFAPASIRYLDRSDKEDQYFKD